MAVAELDVHETAAPAASLTLSGDTRLCRRLEDEDFENVVEALVKAFGRWPSCDLGGVEPAEHLRWKLDGPVKEPHQTVAVADGRIAGVYLTVPRRLGVGDDMCLALDSIDNAVVPEHRGQGLYQEMVRYATGHREAAYDCAWGNYTVSRAVKRVFPRSHGNTLASPIRVAQRVDRFLPYLRSIQRDGATVDTSSLTAGLHLAWQVATRRKIAPRPADSTPHIGNVELFDEAADRLWRKARGAWDLALDRSADTLNWRYFDPRCPRYRVRGWTEGAELLGYAVTACSGSLGFLVDIWALPDRPEIWSGLLDDGLDILRLSDAAAVRCWTTEAHPLCGELARRGFFLLPTAPSMHYEMYTPAATALARVSEAGARVHVALGDSDLV